MKNRSRLTRVIAISLLIAGSNAIAHDPALHAKADEEGKERALIFLDQLAKRICVAASPGCQEVYIRGVRWWVQMVFGFHHNRRIRARFYCIGEKTLPWPGSAATQRGKIHMGPKQPF